MDKPSYGAGRVSGWVFLFGLLGCVGPVAGATIDLTAATVVCPVNSSAREKRAATMLIEEVEKRTGLRWNQGDSWPSTGPVIAVGSEAALRGVPVKGAPALLTGIKSAPGPEGYHVACRRGEPNAVLVAGIDERGVLFGVGRLLRELQMQRGTAVVADDLDVVSSPKYRLRGHQLGFRPKCNSYDAWDLPVWEQYFRDLAVFGCNAIELIPPRSDDAADSPHFPRSPIEMMIGMSRLADAYGLDVWIWYPAMDPDYSDPKQVEFALKEWSEVFSRLPRIDAVFVPGGDPGHTQPKWLMPLLAKQTESLHRYHPKAAMWLSPQGFTQEWMEEFLGILERDKPEWLTGLVFGPQVRMPLPQLRERVSARYPIRHYPDITHTRQCQFPVPDWDVAYAITEARECINPRPEGEAVIFKKTQPYTVGFLTYSEGCNDDVNKIVWSGLGWDPEQRVNDILRQYSRYFIGERCTEPFAEGLLALEKNWQSPLAANKDVEGTLEKFQRLEKTATPAELRNWRFQQALFRAYYDAYIQRRLAHETGVEAEAMKILRQAHSRAEEALAAAEKVLDSGAMASGCGDLQRRIHELAEALFQSIGMQLSVGKYKAIGVDRGASLDTLDFPLNNRLWLKERFAAIRALTSEPEKLAQIREIVDWTDPGPGGFYDDLGNPARQPHLVRGAGFSEDPGSMHSPRVGFEEDPPDEAPRSARRLSWMDHAETLYDTPLRMHYSGLERNGKYKLRVVYAGDSPKRQIRLVANDSIEIHPYMAKPVPFKRLEFALPGNVTAKGELSLSWYGETGRGANGRWCQVSEVWLMKDDQQRAGASQ